MSKSFSGSISQDVRELLAKKTPEIQKLTKELLIALETDQVAAKITESDGKDIRHFIDDKLFSEIELREEFVRLVLTVEEGSIIDPDFVWNKPSKGTRTDRGKVRIYTKDPIPKKIFNWISMAREYVQAD
jgi:hypothetical protein